MRTRALTLAGSLLLTAALTACGSSNTPKQDDPKPSSAPATPSSPAAPPTSDATPSSDGGSSTSGGTGSDTATRSSSLPPNPTGKLRRDVLDAIASVNPELIKHEDKAVDAARNQCSSIIGDTPKKDWAASQRFSYKGITTTEEQGAKLNEAIKKTGLCES